MTVGQFISQATDKLRLAGISTAKLDCLVLLEDTLKLNRASLLAHPEMKIPETTEVKLNKKIAQRAQHIPLAYIRGLTEFYGRTFAVNEHTLVPRPESEGIISLLKQLELPEHAHIFDVGAGSGCLGITAALEIPNAEIWLIDIDSDALQIAQKNCNAHQVTAQLIKSNLLETLPGDARIDVVLANLPYVPNGYPINAAARHEPKHALFAGEDGLDLFERLWQEISGLSSQPKFVITESLQSQHPALIQLAQQAGYKLTTSAGLAQGFEVTR